MDGWIGITSNGWFQLVLFMAVLFACAKPLGGYMANVYAGERHLLSPLLSPLEKLFYRLSGIKADKQMHWREYAVSAILFNLGGFLLLFLILIAQGALPFNPQGFGGLPADLAFNTAVSFVTNTNWQAYGGESALSYFSQMAGLTVQNFLSASCGMAVLIALVRGLSSRKASGIGNFWVDMLRSNLYILLPLALLGSVLLSGQGVVQTFSPYVQAQLLEPQARLDEETQRTGMVSTQLLAVGPVASQVSIKHLGTNGGGFFNANSSHPFENPTPLSNFLQMLGILIIPVALCFTFGTMIGDVRQGRSVLAAMTLIFVPIMLFAIAQEQHGNPRFGPLGIEQAAGPLQPGGNMEGKESRFGIVNSGLFAAVTTAASCGSVNSMHASYTPLGGMAPMVLMQFGEVVYGGVGSGLYGMLMFVIITVFIAGLMVGRTPEYLGKKIQAFEMKMAAIAILVPCASVLVATAIAVLTQAGQAGIFNPGAQGFSEVLYATTSASNNNGSAFAGLSANTPFYNTLLGFCMLFGRFWIMIPVLAVAGSLASKHTVPASAGTLPTHTPLFIMVLVAIVVLVGVLTFVPALALGPVAEYFNLMQG